MLIGELATTSGISRETLRFYEQLGLIRAQRLANGYRDYPAQTLMLVNYIRTAQQLGFTLAEIGEKLPGIWQAEDANHALVQVMGEKLQQIDHRIAQMQDLRNALADRLDWECPFLGKSVGKSGSDSNLITN